MSITCQCTADGVMPDCPIHGERPVMPQYIADHVYQSDYAGLDPAKQVCNVMRPGGVRCGELRSEHTRFITPGAEEAMQMGVKMARMALDGFGGRVDAADKQPDEFEWFDHCEVNFVESTFNDDTVCFAAWTSTKGDEAGHEARRGLINRLMKDRHGSPFEHMWIQFQVTAPIFVWREHHRHRMASYNEESARYRTMRPRFYLPPRHRPMKQVEGTKPMNYVMVELDDADYEWMIAGKKHRCIQDYRFYEDQLARGIVREVARTDLPVSLMSTCIVTMNCRGLMNFLSLRVKDPRSAVPTNPQWEINQVALQYENHFARLAPMTHEAFITNGRVCP